MPNNIYRVYEALQPLIGDAAFFQFALQHFFPSHGNMRDAEPNALEYLADRVEAIMADTADPADMLQIARTIIQQGDMI